MKKWITLFSQTGTEIYNLINHLNILPDVIITNRQTFEGVNEKLLDVASDRFCCVPDRPSVEEYRTALELVCCKAEDMFITMHGYLRIIPSEICNDYEIYNLHPAPLKKHPDLKGKDPQKRIASTPYMYYGNTIHKCTPELDGGEIILEEHYPNLGYTLENIINYTHAKATTLWFDFLKKKL